MAIRTKGRLLLLMVVSVSGAALVGCSPGKAPSAKAPSAAAGATPGPAAAAAAPANSGAPAAAPTTPASGGAADVAGADKAAPAQPDLVLLAGAAFDGCKAPAAPPDPPDGHVATQAQMLSSHKLTADFNSATNGYLACLDLAAKNFNGQYGRILSPAGVRQVVDLQDRIHNKAVDADQAVANRFNLQLRAFKARGGKP